MSEKIAEIVEKIKVLTLVEASELKSIRRRIWSNSIGTNDDGWRSSSSSSS